MKTILQKLKPLLFFEHSLKNSLAEILKRMIDNKKHWIGKRFEINESCKAKYPVELMIQQLILASQT
jgi:hypothetical protein